MANNLQSRKWCFTLNNYTDDEYRILLEWCATKIHYIIGKEIGENGTPHLQGFVESKGGIRFDTLKNLNDRVHWEKAKGNKKQNFIYCSKENNFVSNYDILTDEERRHSRLLKKYDNVVWKDWQQDIINICESEPDDRTINWIYDEEGNNGKSFLVKYLYLKYGCIIADGKKDNIFNQILNTDLNFKIVVLDVPRHNEGYVNYGVLEQIKDGLIYSGKYEGGICAFDNVHIFVFANFEPDLSKFSADRWNIIEL